MELFMRHDRKRGLGQARRQQARAGSDRVAGGMLWAGTARRSAAGPRGRSSCDQHALRLGAWKARAAMTRAVDAFIMSARASGGRPAWAPFAIQLPSVGVLTSVDREESSCRRGATNRV